ncbi:MAG TPA: methyl-accepting chemotaxis protein [Macromonas sp.]|nr:methyl-accepting chemotaxis protein [Macromonas sp.]
MNFLKKLNIGKRLALAFGLLLVLIVTIAGMGGLGTDKVKAGLTTVYRDQTVPMGQMAEINQLVLRNRMLVVEMLNDMSSVSYRSVDLEDNLARFDEVWKAYAALNHTPEARALVDEFQNAHTAFVDEGLKPTIEALRALNEADARSLYNLKVAQLGDDVIVIGDKMSAAQVDVAAKEFAKSEGVAQTVTLVLSVATVLALVVGVVSSLIITRSIVGPIKQAVEVANTVAAGDLTSNIPMNSKDETGQLLHALHVMNESLVKVVSEVRHGSDSIATGSAEIANGNADLSQRTESQASNLEETAASMEELTATVNQNTETARQASQLAQVAREAANQGGDVVGQVVKTMHDISSSSRKIADIIGVIDGIAFQTNILALNAAVEAARAGEQGRGFAVVAGEVRTLAQRSAQAAKEIKGLIEASVDSVETGSQLVGRAGKSMDNIVTQVQRVADLIGEITAASEEQSNGIAQVGSAVAQLDQVTQQNAALVEESAAAAESLKSQAARLAEVVSAFKLSSQDQYAYDQADDVQALDAPYDAPRLHG